MPTRKFVLLITICLFIAIFNQWAIAKQESTPWKIHESALIASYEKMDLEPLQLSFIENINAIEPLEELDIQRRNFLKFKATLSGIVRSTLSAEDLIDFYLVEYDIELNIKRLELEIDWQKNNFKLGGEEKIFDIPNGPQWYRYYLNKWIDMSADPDDIFQLGLNEIDRVKLNIETIKKKSGLNEDQFWKALQGKEHFYLSASETKMEFERASKRLSSRLKSMFEGIDEIPRLEIRLGTNRNLAQVPGFYTDNTLYFNFFGSTFKKRQVEWLFFHEAVPGHHYQLAIESSIKRSRLRTLIGPNPSFTEGWAAYTEDLAVQANLYTNMYSELGKWEWDLVRSIRVSLDVGINYYGWSDEKALSFWREHLKGEDDIARREIARMKRWPAQVITYKFGAIKILSLQHKARASTTFNLKDFHRYILSNGALPFSVLERLSLRIQSEH